MSTFSDRFNERKNASQKTTLSFGSTFSERFNARKSKYAEAQRQQKLIQQREKEEKAARQYIETIYRNQEVYSPYIDPTIKPRVPEELKAPLPLEVRMDKSPSKSKITSDASYIPEELKKALKNAKDTAKNLMKKKYQYTLSEEETARLEQANADIEYLYDIYDSIQIGSDYPNTEALPNELSKYNKYTSPSHQIDVQNYINRIKNGSVKFDSKITNAVVNSKFSPENYGEALVYIFDMESPEFNAAHMSNIERQTYFLLLQNEGVIAADTFYKELEPILKKRRSNDYSHAMQKVAENSNGVEKAILTGGEIASVIASPLEYSQRLFSDEVSGLQNFTSGLESATGEIANDIAKDNEFGSWAYQLGISAGKSLLALGVSGGNAMAVKGLMGSDAAVSAMNEAEKRGLGRAQTLIYGTSVGAIEAITESIGLEALFGNPQKSVGYVLKNMAAEATEEALSEVLGNVADGIINMDESLFMNNVERYVQEGCSEKEALKKALFDIADDTVMAAAGGAVLGGAFAGLNTAIDIKGNMQKQTFRNAFDSQVGEMILQGDSPELDIQNLIDNVDGKNKALLKAAQKVNKSKVDLGELGMRYDADPKDIGKLARLSGENNVSKALKILEAKKQAFISALSSLGMSSSKAENAYKTLLNDARAGKISAESSRIIQTNDFGRSVYEEMSHFFSPQAVDQRLSDANQTFDNRSSAKSTVSATEELSKNGPQYEDPVSIESINEYGTPTLRTANGETFAYDGGSETVSETAKRKIDYARLHGISGANAYLKLSPDYQNSDFDKAFEKLYSDGLNGRSFSLTEADIPEDAQRAIYNSGRSDLENAAARSRRAFDEAKKKESAFVKKQMGFKSDRVTVSDAAVEKIKGAKTSSLRKQYRASAEVIEALASMLQVDINIIASEVDAKGNYISPNGSYDPETNTFTFDILAGMNNTKEVAKTAMLKTAGHELTHFVQNWSPSKYIKLKNVTLRFLAKQQGEAWIEQRLDSIIGANEKAGKKLTREQARDELVADSFENVLSEVDFAETVFRTDETLFGKIHRWIKDNIAKFKKNLSDALKGVGAQTEAGKVLEYAGEEAAELYHEWEDAFITALENSSSLNNPAEKLSYQTRDFSSQVDEVLNGTFPRGESVYVGATPEILGKVGLNPDLPMLTTARHIVTSTNAKNDSKHYHGIKAEQIKALPEKIASPALILDSLSPKSDSIIVVTDMVDEQGNPIIVPIKVNGKGVYNQVEILANFITSCYGKDNFDNFLKRITENNNLLYINKNKAAKLSVESTSQWVEQLKAYDFDTIIRQTNAKVNTQLQARNLNSDLDTVTRRDLADALDMHADTLSGADKAKLKLTMRAYRDAINAYDDARADFQDALRSGNEELTLLASATLTLHETVIDDIERSEAITMNLKQFKNSLTDTYAKEKGRAKRAAFKEYELKRSRISGEAREAISAMRSKLTEAEQLAKESAKKAESASFRARQESMRRKRDLYSGRLGKLRTTLKAAIDKPSETASIPKGGERLAENILGITGTLNELLRARGTARSNDELITLIHRTAIANSYGNKSHKGTSVETTERMINAADSLQRQLGHELAALKEEYDRIQESPTASLAYRDELATRLTEYIAENETMYVGGEEMLHHISDGITLMRAISHRLMSSNRAMVAGKWVNILDLRDNLMEDIEIAPKLSAKVLNKISYALTPKTMLHLAFGATENSDTLYAMYDDAQTRYMQYVNGAKDIFKELESETAKNKINGTEAKIRTGLADTDGNEVLLNPDLAISFVLASENEDYLRHMIWGGFQLPDLKTLYSTKSDDAYVGNRFTEHLTAEQSIKDYLGEKISEEDIAAALDRIEKQRELSGDDFIIYQAKVELESNGTAADEARMKEKYRSAARLIKSQLDPLSLRWMNAIRNYYNGYAKEHLDKATMERYGFTKTLSSANVYYPIKVVKSQVGGEQNELVKYDATLESIGSMKSRKKSKAGVRLFGAVSSLNNQIEQTATYYGWINAIDTIKKTLNSRIELENGDVTTLMDCVSKQHANTTLDKYLKELENEISGNGNKPSESERFISFLHSAFVSSALAFNLSPALKQTSALPLVAADSGYKSLFRGTLKGVFGKGEGAWKPILTKSQINYIAKYSTVYKFRAGGMINIDLAALKNSSNPISKFMQKYPNATGVSWSEFVDAQTLGFQFYAIRDSVQKAHPNRSAEEINIEAGKQLDKVIQNFQANYTVLQRAPILRGNGVGKLLFGTFKSQQITLFNAQVDSVLYAQTLQNQIKAKRGDSQQLKNKLRKSVQYAIKIAAASAVSYIVNAALAMLVAIAYRRKKWNDEELIEDAGWEILQSYMQMLPIIGDLSYWLVEKIAKRGYYNDSLGEIGAIQTLEDMFSAMFDIAEKMPEGELTIDRAAKDFGKILAPAGIPFRNAYNILKALLEWCGIEVK